MTEPSPIDPNVLAAAVAAAADVFQRGTATTVAPSPPPAAPTGPPTYQFNATVDWSEADQPTPRTGLAGFDADGITQLAVTRYTQPPHADPDAQPASEDEPVLYVRFAGRIVADSDTDAQDVLRQALDVVAENSAPAGPGWATSVSVRPA